MSRYLAVAFAVACCIGGIQADVLTFVATDTQRENRLRLRLSGAQLELSNDANGVVLARRAAAATTGVVIRGANGNVDDTLTVDFGGGDLQLIDGIRYDGGRGGYDVLVVEHGAFARSSHVIHNDHSGVLRYDELALIYSNLEPVVDTAGSATYVINATDAANTITIDNGTSNGDGLIRVSIDATEPISFANKQNVTINGGLTAADGNDLFILNFTDLAFALQSITLNGDDSGGTASGNDIFSVQNTQGVTIHINAGQGNDQVIFSGSESLGSGAVNGGAGTDVLDYTSVMPGVFVNLGSNAPNLAATLGNDQEVPPTASAATGTATMTYDNVTHLMNISVTVNGIAPADVTGFHIHSGGAGVNGPVLINLQPAAPLVPNGSGGFTYDDLTIFPPLHEAALLSGATYINIHTAAAPGGLIRGQIFAAAPLVAATGTASFMGTVTNFENVIGGSGPDGLIGGPGVNDINGMLGDDVIAGGRGNDILTGDAGADLFLWSREDDSDAINGGAGTDAVQVHADGSGDLNIAAGAGGRLAVSRAVNVPFTLDIGTAETLTMAGTASADTFITNDLSTVTSLAALNLHGFAGSDRFVLMPASSAIPIAINGGVGSDDRITGPNANGIWNITAPDTGNIAGLVSAFQFVETLFGGSANDAFVFANAATQTAINGQGGTDTLDYSAYATPVAVNLGSNGTLSAQLAREEEVPPTTAAASGTAIANYNPATHQFQITIDVLGITPAQVTGLHIHRAAAGVNGPIVLDLQPLASLVPLGSGFTFTAAGIVLPPPLIASLLGGFTYVNVHTAAFPGGAIRGQLLPITGFGITVSEATGVGGFTNIENASGGTAADGLIGDLAANVLSGGPGDDTLLGAGGVDVLSGDDGDDSLAWTDFAASDVMNGGTGNDTVQVSGSSGLSDVFVVAPGAGGRIAFTGTVPLPYALDIGTTETLTVLGKQGNDSFTVNDLAGVAPFSALMLHGMEGNDTFAFAAANASGFTFNVNGAAGSDTIFGPNANEVWNITGVDAGNITGLVSTFWFVENLTGGSGIDTFNMRGSPNAPYTVVGGNPAVLPGDTLNYDSQLAAVFGDTTPPDGMFNSTGMQPVTFSQIEAVNLINADADVTITKSDAPDPVTAGTNVTYTIVVMNAGPAEAANLSLSDAVPANTTFVSFTAPAGWTTSTPAAGGTGTVTATTASLPIGGSATFTLVVRVAASTLAASTITNTATIATSSTDPGPGSNSATATTTVTASSDVGITKTGGGSTVPPGGTSSYTITLSNLGPSDARIVTMTDVLPPNTTFASLTQTSGPVFTCTTPAVGATGTVTCTLGTFPAGSTATFSLVLNIASSAVSGTTINNTATVTSATTDPNPANNTSTAAAIVGVAIPLLSPLMLMLFAAMLGIAAVTRMK